MSPPNNSLFRTIIPRPGVWLTDGNGYAIMSKCVVAAAKSGWSLSDWRSWSRRARAGAYEDFLWAVFTDFDVRCAATFSTNPDDWRSHGAQADDD